MEELKNYLNLGEISLGTMRFLDKSLNINDVVNLIEKAYDVGITTHHSSVEYNSYPIYSEALKKSSCSNKIKHITKIAAPHFEDVTFSSKLFEERVDNELRALNIEQIDVLQWLLRSKPINDKKRLDILNNFKDKIENTLQNLKKKGKVKSIFSFPYSVTFANKVLELDEIDGLTSYLNEEEQEYSKFATQTPFIAIRPFFSGTLLKKSNNNINSCISYVNSHDSVINTIVGINSLKHLEAFKK